MGLFQRRLGYDGGLMIPMTRTITIIHQFLALFLFASISSKAMAVVSPAPPTDGGLSVPNVSLWDDEGHATTFFQVAQKPATDTQPQQPSAAVVVLPLYTSCSQSCPILTQKLKNGLLSLQGTSTPQPKVILFSFDPDETTESLKAYREHQKVPAPWSLVRATEKDLRTFFDFFHYSIMTSDKELVHPNQIFLLDAPLHWKLTLIDVDWTSQDLTSALFKISRPSALFWLQTHPESLAWLGFIGLILGILFLSLLTVVFRNKR